jgi:hypothetical protein
MNWQIPFNENEEQARERMLAAYHHFMDFIGDILPDFSTRADVGESDLLWRYLDDELDEEENGDDLARLRGEFPTKEDARKRLIEIESELAHEALEYFYTNYFA